MGHRSRTKRRRDRISRRTPPGAPPGMLVTDPAAPAPEATLIAYGPDRLEEVPLRSPADVCLVLKEWPVTWVNVDGLGDAGRIEQIGTLFGLHRLALEDVLNVHQRPKVEGYGTYLFIVVRMPMPGEAEFRTEQLSLFVGENYVLSFQEHPGGDVLEHLRHRIRTNSGRIRVAGPAYLAYAIVDAVVDAYYPVLERFGERLDTIEELVLTSCTERVVPMLHTTKRDLLALRRAVWPLREMVGALAREPGFRIDDETRLYLRDCYDHTVQIMDLVEMYRELSADLLDLHISYTNNRINEIIRALTIVATVCIPPTLITSCYGMNFDTDAPWNMPELHWRYGYLFALGMMLLCMLGTLVALRVLGVIRPRRPDTPGPPPEEPLR